MRPTEPSLTNQIQLHRLACSKCGQPTQLARIEHTEEPDHDMRMFECTACQNTDTMRVKFK